MPLKRVRGNPKAFAEFRDQFLATTSDTPALRVGIAHAAAPERLEALRKLVRDARPQAHIDRRRRSARSSARTRDPARSGSSGSRTAENTVEAVRSGSYAPAEVATMTRMHAGFAGVVQRRVAAPARLGAARAARRSASTRSRASARRSRSGCALSGIETVRDLLLHRPRRYERAVDEVPIAQLWGDDEVAIAGDVVDVRVGRLAAGGRSSPPVSRDDSGDIGASWFNQPWLAEGCVRERTCGCAGSSAGTASTSELRRRRCARDRRLRARLSGERGCALVAAP